MDRIKVIVEGRVQGIGYRYFVKKQAEAHQIKGHVKNLPGGAVEIDAEGESYLMEAFLSACRQGPPHAVIEGFHRKKVTPYGFTRFRIKHSKDY